MTDSLILAPMLPVPLIVALAALGLVLVGVGIVRGGRGTVMRGVVLAVLTIALLNPQAVRERREQQRDVAVVVVDKSLSQRVGERRKRTAEALAGFTQSGVRYDDLEIQVVEVDDAVQDTQPESEHGKGTRLFTALGRAAADIPRNRFAGAVLITDGQVHDVPDAPPVPGPIHVVLTGERGESDRRLVIENAPGYGIVGQEITIKYRVEDQQAEKSAGFGNNLAKVRLRYDGEKETVAHIPAGRSDAFKITLDHAGPTIIEIDVEPIEGELSTINNKALVTVNGVRDRLRVLLVSGQPHAGERTWRNLLKSDPSVDLVHFTILRPPEKDDFTPLRELALIAFPIQELFEAKLKEFDLIVFDRYIIRDVLPPSYLRNIVNFVREGGALLLALGPEFAETRSLYQTPLAAVMPASPTGQVVARGFKPRPTDTGERHPVTARLPGSAGDDPEWGRWFRQIEAVPRTGRALLQGVDGKPLLLLERAEKGRVAQFLSDHIWLWARGFEGGGPQAELLRRLAHWLMKEPDLEEESLTAEVRGRRLIVERRSLNDDEPEVTVTMPSGETRKAALEMVEPGLARTVLEATETGLYKATDGTDTALATQGTLNPLEFADLRTSADAVHGLVHASGGGVHWLTDGIPDIRRTRPGRDAHGGDWIGLVANRSFIVTGVAQVPLVPGLLVMALVLAGLMAAWYREGR